MLVLTEKIVSKIHKDDLFSLSAALSYYTALSLAPLLILLLTFLSSLAPDLQVKLVEQIDQLIGEQAATAAELIIESAQNKPDLRSWAGVVGLFTLLFSAGAIFGHLRHSLNKIFEVTRYDEEIEALAWYHMTWGYARKKIFNMGMVVTFVFISIVSLIISSAISLYFEGAAQVVGQIVNFIFSITIFTCLFAGIFYFLPSRKIKKRVALLSGLLTAVLFSIGKILIGLYLGRSAVGSSYGAAGSMIILLMWVYYSSSIIFICAEIAHQVNKRWKAKSANI